MKKITVVLAGAMLVTCCLSAQASVVVVKRNAGFTDFRGFDAGLTSALSGGSATVYTGAGMVADVGGLSTDQGWAQSDIYRNRGGSTVGSNYAPMLFKFGLSALPGFVGGTVAKAELRLYTAGGNSGNADAGYITTSDWIEGSSDGSFPGAAGGVSGAHPMGYNTDAYQTADGTPVNVGYPPNMSIAPFSGANNQPFAAAKDAVTLVSGGLAHNPWGVTAGQWDQYITIDITPILSAWASGTANYGMYFQDGNYSPYMSENMTNADWQPVLVMDYVPAPEPMSLSLLALAGLAALRRRGN